MLSVDLIRERLSDPWSLCERLGLLDGPRSYQRHSRGLLVRCPVHDERTPSCSIYRGRNGVRFNCFGCNEAGDVFSLIAICRGWEARSNFRRVLSEAAYLADIAEPTSSNTNHMRPVNTRLLRPQGIEDEAFGKLTQSLLDLCPLSEDPEVLHWLSRRGLLRYVGGWGVLPKHWKKQQQIRAHIISLFGEATWLRSGLAVAQGAGAGEWLWPEHRLLIPWRNAGVDGTVHTLQRRIVRDLRPGDHKYIFASGRPPQHPYGIEDAVEEIEEGCTIVLVEGALDTVAYRALACVSGVNRAVLGLPGLSWSPRWNHWVHGHRVLIALDDDDAGNRRAETLWHELRSAGAAEVERARPVDHKDWAEALAAKGQK